MCVCACVYSLFCVLSRLLRALVGLKRVIINAAHFLVMKNRDVYRFYQSEPFLETVSLDTHYSLMLSTDMTVYVCVCMCLSVCIYVCVCVCV